MRFLISNFIADHQVLIILVAVGVLFGPSLVTSLTTNGLNALWAWLASLLKPKPNQLKPVVIEGIDDTIASLQAIVKWAVKNADAESLSKITALYAELQRHIEKEKQ